MDLSKAYVLDIETNGLFRDLIDYSSFPYKLLPTAKLWCVVVTNVASGESFVAKNEEITKEWLKDVLKDCDIIVAHNGIKFDFPMLKLFGVFDYEIGYLNKPDTIFGKEVKFLDTLIMSRLFNPDRFGGHSLESWGERVGDAKIDFRKICIENEIIEPSAPRGAEFYQFCEEMVTYCIQDTKTNVKVFYKLVEELVAYDKWFMPLKQENKLADLAIKRENLGFWFDKELAVKCLEDLGEKMKAIEDSVNPILPLRKMNKGELSKFTPPKNQFKKDGSLSANMEKFIDRVGGMHVKEGAKDLFVYEDKCLELPYKKPIKEVIEADITNIDHVKMYLISLGWDPLEWRERDLTKDAKKQLIPYEKRIKALEKWFEETMNGKYKEKRLEILGTDPKYLLDELSFKLTMDKPVRVPTSPCVRVGVEKELCPNLTKLGDKVSFAKDFALYLTYKHRKSSIAGGDIDDMDFDEEAPNTGYLSVYRDVDGRVPTPAIEVGASTTRYKHVCISNIPRASSVYGKEMRSLFGSGPQGLQLGYDFSSLEARIMGHYVIKYPGGEEMAEAMLAEKPNDLHTKNAEKLGISRSDAKSINYGIIYGAMPPKISKMLNKTLDEGQTIYNNFWEAVPALKELKQNLEIHWEKNERKFIKGIDGRKITTRSKHSILNALFQSAGVVCAKYVTVLVAQKLESSGHIIDPFVGKPSVCSMIEYHDEAQYFIEKSLAIFKTFKTEEEANVFVSAWEGEGQLSAISEGNSWYVCLPNDVSLAIEDSIKNVENLLKLNVNLGYEWIINKNWYGCH